MRTLAISILIVLGATLLALPATAQYRSPYPAPRSEPNVLRFHAGLFQPDGGPDYWRDKRREFTGAADGLEDVAAGFDYLRLVSERLAVLGAVNAFEGSLDQSYLDFVDESGANITHTTSLEIVSFDLGLLWFITHRSAPVVPYIGGGGGIYSWTLEEKGDFIDFGVEPPVIFTDTFDDKGETFGWFALAGLDIPVSDTWTVFVEGKWQWAKDRLGGDFEGFGDLDLSGPEFRAGFSFAF